MHDPGIVTSTYMGAINQAKPDNFAPKNVISPLSEISDVMASNVS